MGCAGSKAPEATAVDKQLADLKETDKLSYKLLLLGAGESGKSTVLKQVKIIYKGTMTDKDRQQCTLAIRHNAVECMQTVLSAMGTLDIRLGCPANAPAMERVLALGEDTPFSAEVAADIHELWKDAGVKEALEQREKYWLLDAADYYFNEVLRLAEEDYTPTEDDIIMTRIRTTGIDTTEFTEGPRTYSIVDVGGQRNERRKWIHCFDNVKAVVFLVGLSGYNQRLFEDSDTNRMQESLKLFKQVAGNPIFKGTPIFLFLNKKDLFEQMIKKTPLSVCFPEFNGPGGDVHSAIEFSTRFLADAFCAGRYREVAEATVPGKPLFVHVVAARVRMDMKVAWGDVKDQLKNIYEKKNSGVWTKLLAAQ
ncbi:unnamed protein product [Phaeothamnion confervicola]